MEKRMFYKTRDIAEMFGIDILTAQSWCREGKIKAVKIGRDWYIPISELEKLGLKFDESIKVRE